jgi:tetratricopeptide (TPR) repeat protein
MGIFDLFKKKKVEEGDYIASAEQFEKAGDFTNAVNEYQKLINLVFSGKEPKFYRHITKKIVACYVKLGDYEKVIEMWPSCYDSSDYGPKEMYELIKILEGAQRFDLVMRVYDDSGNKLLPNKIEFLIKQKKIPEANALLNELLAKVPETNPSIKGIWLTKAKVCMSLRKWEESAKYLNKILERDNRNIEVLKLKEFCMKQVRMS